MGKLVLFVLAQADENVEITGGTTAEAGVEHFLTALPNTSVELSLAHHFVFAQRDDQFPSGWNSNVLPVELRICVNYYFDMLKPKQGLPTAAPPKP